MGSIQKSLILAALVAILCVFFISCSDDKTINLQATVPTVKTAEVSSVTNNTAVSGGNVTLDGGAMITARGVCWSTGEPPTLSDNITSDGSGLGSFTSSMEGLAYNTTYYVRAYATNSLGTSYGNTVSFTTAVPLLTTAAASVITRSTAETGGNITSDAGSSVTARGICWNTSETPTLDDNIASEGSGTGSFTVSMEGLAYNTTYYVRAYATNGSGTGYGNTITFTTLDSAYTVTDVEGNVYQALSIGTQVWMIENLKVKKYRNGESLWHVSDNEMWVDNVTTGAYCSYENNESNVTNMGRLYNWFSVVDARQIAPAGWHIPSEEEWQTLLDFLYPSAAGKLMEVGYPWWGAPSFQLTNESGFSARGAGCRRGDDGTFDGWREFTGYWTTEEAYPTYGGQLKIDKDWGAYLFSELKNSGYSIRCIKDQP